MRANLWIWLLVAATGLTALGRDLYVNNLEGDDLQTGYGAKLVGRGNGPLKSISVALRRAQPGDHIILAATAQPYRESITLQAAKNSGMSDGVPFVIEGNGAVLDGSLEIDPDAWEHVKGDVFRFAPNFKSFQVLLLDGQPAVRVAVERDAKQIPDLKPLEWCLWRGNIYFRTETDRLPLSYFPSCGGGQVGITIYDVRDVVIRDLQVTGFALDGINAHDNAFNVRLERVTTIGNGRSGISIGGASRAMLVDCNSAFNFSAQLRVEGFCETKFQNCKFDPAAAPAIEHTGGKLLEIKPE